MKKAKRQFGIKSAAKEIDRAGALLVFPINNKPEPASLWSSFLPKEKMLWEWDEDGDDRVAKLWRLKTDLSTTRLVIYTKWYSGRATYFSKPLFTAMLRALSPNGPDLRALSSDARRILDILESESPLSTKELKRMADFKGRDRERSYEKALKELWSRLWIVAYGEFDDGAFPSLGIGSTRALYDELWQEAFAMSTEEAHAVIAKILQTANPFLKYFTKLKASLALPIPVVKNAPQISHGKKPGQKKKDRAPQIKSVIRFEDL
jgi:hypothetical protein